MTEVKKCNTSEFFKIYKCITLYLGKRPKDESYQDAKLIIKLLYDYFSLLIFYQSNSPKKHHVNIQGETHFIKMDISVDGASTTCLDIVDVLPCFIDKIFQDLSNIIDPNSFNCLIKTMTEILNTNEIETKYKLYLINEFNEIPEIQWEKFIRLASKKVSLRFIESFKNLIKITLSSDLIGVFSKDHIQEEVKLLHEKYKSLIKFEIEILIFKKHLVDIQSFLMCEANKLKRGVGKYFDHKNIINYLLYELVLSNNLFQIQRREDIQEFIDQFRDTLTIDEISKLRLDLYFNPEEFTIHQSLFRSESVDISSYDLTNIKTKISFVIPYKIDNSKQIHHEHTDYKFKKIDSLFDDPIFKYSYRSNFNINGLPFSFLSDSIGRTNDCCVVEVILEEFYKPDINIVNGKFEDIDFSEEEAKRGIAYHPHKELITEKLLNLFKDGKLPLDITKPEINSNIFSNYLVTYFVLDNREVKMITTRVYLVTSVDSYIKSRKKFLDSINAHYFNELSTDLRDYIMNVNINSQKSFLEFCCKVFKSTLLKAVESGGLHVIMKDKESKPLPESKAQIIIYNLIRFILEIKGVNISRENVAADGSVDFTLSYTSDDKLLTVCVEVKNAHHNNIKHGIQNQLPLYIRDVGKREGIFLVLWYKSSVFKKPEKYDCIKDLNKYLSSLKPRHFNIKVITIDCIKPLPPSNPKRLLKE